jgi:NIPSNAP
MTSRPNGRRSITTDKEKTMRTYELRAYTLSSAEALDSYRTVNYLRHLASFAHHNIGLHGLWTAHDRSPVLYALVSYAEGADTEKVTEQFMNSAEFHADVEGLDPSTIVDVASTLLTPSAGSPLL